MPQPPTLIQRIAEALGLNPEAVQSAVEQDIAAPPPPVLAPARRLLTVDEFCEATHLSRTTAYGLIRSGDVKTVTVGRARRISSDALDEFVATLSEEAS